MTLTVHNLIRAAIVPGITAMLAAMAACSNSAPAEEADPAVAARVGSLTLTDADIAGAVPAGLSREDSLRFVQAYIASWTDDALLSEVATAELPSTDEIERLTEEYRRSLIMAEYRRLRLSADTSLAVSRADIDAYYADHKEEMRLSEPMVRGIYIKIEDHAPALANVRKWYRSDKMDDIDRLEKVGLKGAIHYDYFRDKWIPFSQVANKIPTEIAPSQLRKGYTLDHTGGGFTYLLSVSDVLPAGTVMPEEAAEPRIRETLDALRLNALDARLRADLRRQALDAGTLYLRR